MTRKRGDLTMALFAGAALAGLYAVNKLKEQKQQPPPPPPPSSRGPFTPWNPPPAPPGSPQTYTIPTPVGTVTSPNPVSPITSPVLVDWTKYRSPEPPTIQQIVQVLNRDRPGYYLSNGPWNTPADAQKYAKPGDQPFSVNGWWYNITTNPGPARPGPGPGGRISGPSTRRGPAEHVI
jgi:hypothetical protein